MNWDQVNKEATPQERGQASQWREQYSMPNKDRIILNAVVHEKHGMPTSLPMPSAPKPGWVVKPSWGKKK